MPVPHPFFVYVGSQRNYSAVWISSSAELHEFVSMNFCPWDWLECTFSKKCYKMVLHCLVCFQTLILYQGPLQDLNISISRHHIIILKPQYKKGFFSHLICISAFTAITLHHVILVSRCGSLFSDILFILQLNIYCWDSYYVVFLIYLTDRLFKQKRQVSTAFWEKVLEIVEGDGESTVLTGRASRMKRQSLGSDRVKLLDLRTIIHTLIVEISPGKGR